MFEGVFGFKVCAMLRVEVRFVVFLESVRLKPECYLSSIVSVLAVAGSLTRQALIQHGEMMDAG